MPATELLQEMVRFDTTNPPGNEEPLADMLRGRLEHAGLTASIEKSPAGRASLIARVEGPTDRPALVLVSHLDVVAVEENRWTRDPFGGVEDAGAIWGRGTLDMKGIAAMHIDAVTEFVRSGATPAREIIICAVADEEAGGGEGARWLVGERRELVGFGDGRPTPEALGEGGFGLEGIVDKPIMPIVQGEKSALWMRLTAKGDPGHGSLPPKSQAVVSLARAIAKLSGYGPPRVHPVMREQFEALARATSGPKKGVFKALASGAGRGVAVALAGPLRSSGAVAALLSDTLTPTRFTGGYKTNVVPGEVAVDVDCRLLPDTDIEDFTRRLSKKASSYNVTVETESTHPGPVSAKTGLYRTLEIASEKLPENPVVVPSLSPDITDLRYFRARGATAYGWVPLVLTAELLGTIHGHDERVPVKGFEEACAAMRRVVRSAAATSG